MAAAAPVDVGTRFAAPARPLRGRLCAVSTMAWLAVYACTVVMTAFFTPMRRPRISITGVMQLVVQLAHEMMAVLSLGEFTPWTMVSTPSPFEGADKMTYPAPARMWLRGPVA